MTISLAKRGVSCTARLLDAEAPRTCERVWQSLPVSHDALHASMTSNEVYCIVPEMAGEAPGLENPTIMPIPGDVLYFELPMAYLPARTRAELEMPAEGDFSELAVFYDRNNYLHNPATGPVPGNIFATIVDDLAEMADACRDVLRAGSVGERLSYARA